MRVASLVVTVACAVVAATTDPLAPLLARPAIADAVGRTRQAVDALLTHPSLRAGGAGLAAALAAELSMRAAAASAGLDSPHPIGGGAASPGRRNYPDPEPAAESGAAEPILAGALRVQAELTGLAVTWRRAPRQVLARLHLLAAADLVDDPDQLGRPVLAAAPRLDTLSAVLATTTAPAVVVASIVHGELLALAAFPPAAGVVARAAGRLSLTEGGLDPLGLIAIEVGHQSLDAAYRSALEAYRGATVDGIDYWVQHCADAIEIAVRAAFEIINSKTVNSLPSSTY